MVISILNFKRVKENTIKKIRIQIYDEKTRSDLSISGTFILTHGVCRPSFSWCGGLLQGDVKILLNGITVIEKKGY